MISTTTMLLTCKYCSQSIESSIPRDFCDELCSISFYNWIENQVYLDLYEFYRKSDLPIQNLDLDYEVTLQTRSLINFLLNATRH